MLLKLKKKKEEESPLASPTCFPNVTAVNLELHLWRSVMKPLQCIGTVKHATVPGFLKVLLPEQSSEDALN